MLHEHFPLSSPNLEGDRAPGDEVGTGLIQEDADDRRAIGAAVEGGERVVADLAGEGCDVRGGDVGEIRDDEAVPGGLGCLGCLAGWAGKGGKEVAEREMDAIGEAEDSLPRLSTAVT